MSDIDPILSAAAAAPPAERFTILAEGIRRFPRAAEIHLALATVLNHAGKVEEAAAAAQRAIQVKPDFTQAYLLLGAILVTQQKWERAVAAWETALRLDPSNADAWASLADTYGRSGKLETARTALHRELALRPNHGRALVDMGRTYELRERLPDAHEWFKLATVRDPNYADAWHRLGVTAGKRGQLHDAVAALRHALQLEPNSPAPWHDLAHAYEMLDQLEESERAYRRAVELRPNDPRELNALARVLRLLERLDESRALLERALTLDPKSHPIRGEQAILSLLAGDFEKGWPQYECRYDAPDFPGGKPNLKIPRWTGQPLAGKTIILWAEQGLGDTLQFLRFVPHLTALGATVLLNVQPGIERLAAAIPNISRVIIGKIWPPADFQIGLMSLPSVFKITEATLPRDVPYLTIDPLTLDAWRTRVGPRAATKRVGLAWAGTAHHTNDKNRSILLERLRLWFELPNIAWFSLQKGVAENQIAASGLPLQNLMPHALDFMDTGALMRQLDLVISVDTSIVHLAGALAVPVWSLIPRLADWRWMTNRADSPWYPTMRLFRQTPHGDWSPALASVRTALSHFANA